MYLSASQRRTFSDILTLQATAESSDVLREAVGPLMLSILQADTYSSMVWSEKKGIFEHAVAVNETVNRLKAWSSYFRHVDPITLPLMARKRATVVTQILPQQTLMQGEFYNDFLRPHHQHWGINIYFFYQNECVGDFRIWRRCERGNFVKNDADILDMMAGSMAATLHRLGMYSESSTHHPPAQAEGVLSTVFQLSQREASIACLVAEGMVDKNIACQLGISTRTVRFHMSNIFLKCKASNRALVAARVRFAIMSAGAAASAT